MARGSRRRRSRSHTKRAVKRRRRSSSSSSSSSRSRSSSSSRSQSSTARFGKALRLKGNKRREIKNGSGLLEDVSRIAGACRVGRGAAQAAELLAEQVSSALRENIQKAHSLALEALKIRQRKLQASQWGSKKELEHLQRKSKAMDEALNALQEEDLKETQALEEATKKAARTKQVTNDLDQEILRRREAIEKLSNCLKDKKLKKRLRRGSSSSVDEMAGRRIPDSSDDYSETNPRGEGPAQARLRAAVRFLRSQETELPVPRRNPLQQPQPAEQLDWRQEQAKVERMEVEYRERVREDALFRHHMKHTSRWSAAEQKEMREEQLEEQQTQREAIQRQRQRVKDLQQKEQEAYRWWRQVYEQQQEQRQQQQQPQQHWEQQQHPQQRLQRPPTKSAPSGPVAQVYNPRAPGAFVPLTKIPVAAWSAPPRDGGQPEAAPHPAAAALPPPLPPPATPPPADSRPGGSAWQPLPPRSLKQGHRAEAAPPRLSCSWRRRSARAQGAVPDPARPL